MLILWGNSRVMVIVNAALAAVAAIVGSWWLVRRGTWIGLAAAAFFAFMAATSWAAWRATRRAGDDALLQEKEALRRLTCPDCGHVNQETWVFCSRCGFRR